MTNGDAGLRKAIVKRIRPMNPEVLYLETSWPEGERPFDYRAGQWVRLTFPFARGPETRSFSIASPPSRASGLEFAILARPGGGFARSLRQETQPGMELGVTGPYGLFHVGEGLREDSLFVTESTGIASIRPVLAGVLERGTIHGLELVYAGREMADLLFVDEFEALATSHPCLRLSWVLRKPPDLWTGRIGTLVEVVREALSTNPDRRIWIAGFEWTTNPLADLLAEIRFAAERIEIERYD